ncbi:hypothetical protein PoB_005635100 [Plakobranchus ocellatus]|uniref:Uncharacterized protein n=1 Tax=Plakobranchus ocellatus TaxID=259542 RepID=A0AAV4C3C3_9GAST|nr:hypothetical protein PoB_005635100 [Plakobranchus ocellatus]
MKKKSSPLLEEWREKCSQEYGKENIKGVHQLYCAAHVLLGFHSEVMNEIKVYESSENKHPVTTLLKDASDLFGPVGDHRGVGNQWEAFCMERNFKSVIKPYKDNRFNGLFEVAAQVFHHHDDFLSILTSLKC